jgi:hypothetical protein
VLEKEDENAQAAIKELLNFYGLQLQSHAAVLLGLVVLSFGVVQAWGQLKAANFLVNHHAYVFSILGGILGAGFAYEALRLYTYGKLASALISGEERNFSETKKNEIEIQGRTRWEQLLPLNKASVFSTSLVVQTSWLVRNRFLSETLGVKHWIESLSFEGSFLLSYMVLFGSSDGYTLFQSSLDLFQARRSAVVRWRPGAILR